MLSDRMPEPAETPTHPRPAEAGPWALERILSFRTTYLAILCFVLLFVFTVVGAEALLDRHFRAAARSAIELHDFQAPVATQIESRLHRDIYASPWVRVGGVRVSTQVFAKDGRLIALDGHSVLPPPEGHDPAAILREAERLLPATVNAQVSLPINSLFSSGILVLYGAILVWGLFRHNRSVARRESAILEEAHAARETTVRRTQEIESELASVRDRLRQVEPAEHEQAEEIRSLQRERETLEQQLAALATREEELRGKAARAVELDQERQALEELLEEAAGDLSSKEEEIQRLETSLKRAAKDSPSPARGRESELLARRLRTLYKNLEIDDRAVGDLVSLRDETMKLKAEESLKRLADESDNVMVRRKVGGLPPYLSIFELGFAGKGRIYYTKGKQRRFRVLTVGAKNTQKTDLEYLSRLPRDEMA
jgi:hypothetical protein